jgi:hypothetical protein
MLADAATVSEGKVNILGGCWTVTGPGPSQFAIAGAFEVPWDESNRQHTFRFDLIDLDGEPVVPVGAEEPLAYQGQFEVGRPPGVRPGSCLTVPFVLPSPGPIQFPPGGNYEWRLMIDDQSHDDWRIPFTTRSEDGLAEAA